MIDNELNVLSFRTRARTLSVCTTGTMSLAATTTGYTRSSGSFLTDGFAPGMELTPLGFVDNTASTIVSVTALAIVVNDARGIEADAGSRSLTVGLPTLRANMNIGGNKPVQGSSWVEENYVPGTSTLLAGPAQGGLVEETGLSVWRFYVPDNTGFLGITRIVDAFMALFTPGTTMALSDGTTIRVRTDATVKRSQILFDGYGWAVCTVTIPYLAYTNNTVAP